ncbi:hypothetical protein C9422_26820 [Pseudomonas sp. B1(2018)]|nr:hypothetical protein C9422_26820 [Pseudomonas sp. B1(2018)]
MGAGLPAKALGQSTPVQADTPPSRASPLPQGDFMSYPEFVHNNIQLWERACPRKRWVSQHLCKLTRRHRGQARSHSVCVCCRDQALAAIAVTSTRMPSTASEATPTAARTGHGLAK